MTKKILGVALAAGCFLLLPLMANAEHVNVPASAFRSQNEAESIILSGYWGAVYTTDAVFLVAPVNLPDGVYIKNIRAVFYDDDITFDMSVHLVRQNVYLNDHSHLFSVSSSGASTSIQAVSDSTHSTTAAKRLVQNGPVQWYIEADFGSGSSNLRLHHVAIEYQ